MPTGIYKKTKEHIKKIVKSRKRNNKEWHTKETRIKLSLANKGRKLTKEHREKISKNHAKYWLGKHFTEETKKKMKFARRKQFGDKIGSWKGDKAKKRALHRYIRTHKPKPKNNLCEFCHKRKDKNGSTKLEIANINNHKYSRNPNDYKWFHRGCHLKYDYLHGRNKK